MGRLQVDIVSAEGQVFSGEADLVVAPGEVGELAILPSHAPLITTLDAGEIRISEGSNEEYLAVFGGFLEVSDNKVTVLADAAEEASQIDIERAEAAMRQAQERIQSRGAEEDLERALTSLRRAQIRVNTARRQRDRRGRRQTAQ
ncbi:MAG: F0F1 ATP synthase subunit epsilon [Dehalococcoidia bacterium]